MKSQGMTAGDLFQLFLYLCAAYYLVVKPLMKRWASSAGEQDGGEQQRGGGMIESVLTTLYNRYVNHSDGSVGDDTGDEPATNDAREPVQPVLLPRTERTIDVLEPTCYEVLAALIAAKKISKTESYSYLGVKRGGGESYRRAHQLLEAAIADLGAPRYRVVDASGKPTGEYTTQRQAQNY